MYLKSLRELYPTHKVVLWQFEPSYHGTSCSLLIDWFFKCSSFSHFFPERPGKIGLEGGFSRKLENSEGAVESLSNTSTDPRNLICNLKWDGNREASPIKNMRSHVMTNEWKKWQVFEMNLAERGVANLFSFLVFCPQRFISCTIGWCIQQQP